MILLKHDSRDKVYNHVFGQVISLPNECDFDSSLYDDVQPVGDVKCVCYSVCDGAEDQQKREFDILDLWERIPKTQFGSDPRDVLKEAVSNGLLPKGQTGRVTDWKSYWSALQGLSDNFDNVRSAIYLTQSPILCATYWYMEWLSVPAFGVMPEGKNRANAHAYSIEGWKMVNGEPMLIIEAWIGRKMYMPRSVFNKATTGYGMQAWVLSTMEIDSKRQRTILETIKDACLNVIILMKQLLAKKAVEKPIEVKASEVYDDLKNELKEAKPTPKYDWSTPQKARHSVRVICDEEGLTVTEKNELCATIGGESGWNPRAIGKVNPDKYKSRDYGIIQLNDHYWIGEGKPFPNTTFVLENPEFCVRWMCKQWRKNKRWWYAYVNGSYKKFL